MNKIENLQEEYNHFIKKYGLPLISADDLRVEVYHKRGEVYTNHEHIFPKHDKEIMEFLDNWIPKFERLI
jgi:hypothetical protein